MTAAKAELRVSPGKARKRMAKGILYRAARKKQAYKEYDAVTGQAKSERSMSQPARGSA